MWTEVLAVQLRRWLGASRSALPRQNFDRVRRHIRACSHVNHGAHVGRHPLHARESGKQVLRLGGDI
jgi:hypothetical protein